jgi:hypothetical protein
MATTNHVRVSNYPLDLVQTKGFEAFWKLTRCLKKAGWKYKASSNGTTKVSNGDPAADNWGGGVTSNAGAGAASIAVPSRGRATITGLTGIVASDKGRFLLISGAATGANNNQHQIEEVLSSTSVRIDARQFAVAADANNGALTWSIVDPLGDLYSTVTAALNANVAWWTGQGPSILRIPIITDSIGTFQVGENLVQTTTGAEGECLGYTYYKGYGWLVVAPRLRGTGAGVHGWDTANLVTGSESGATVTQVGAAIDYVHEVTFIKPVANTTIQILVTQAATVGSEATELFSFCATQAGCTATVHPGGGGTGNAFGAHAWVMWGTGTTAGSGSLVAANTSTFLLLNAQYVCVDCIPEQGYSADGSWNLFIPSTMSVSTTPVGGILYGFNILDNIEEGEISPYVTVNPGGTKTLYTVNRASAGTLTTISGQTDMCRLPLCNAAVTTRTFFNGWRGRGVVYNFRNQEYFTEMEACAALAPSFGLYEQARVSTPTYRMLSSASPYAKTREPIAIVSSLNVTVPIAGNVVTTPFTVKGTLRWLYWINGDQVTDVYGTDPAWTQLSSNPTGAMVVGPTDGAFWTLSL